MALKVLMISRPTLFTVPGGDTVQIQETAAALQQLGVEVSICLADDKIDYSGFDLLHFFNVIRPNAIAPHVRKSKLPFVISTIFVDYSEIEKNYRGRTARMIFSLLGPDGLEYLKTIARGVRNGERMMDLLYFLRGHKRSVERLLNKAAMLLPNSNSEYERLKRRYRFNNKYRVVPNAVSDDFFQESDATERKGVVCVARIELIKNQLNLIHALVETNIPLTLIGSPAPNHQAYFEQCVAVGGDNVTFLGHCSKSEVKSAVLKAKVHVLPSFFETTGLSSLEAAALGCNVVITERGDTREYFGDLAFYCQPEDPISIRKAIQDAINQPYNPSLRQRIHDNYRWINAAMETLEAYRQVLGLEE